MMDNYSSTPLKVAGNVSVTTSNATPSLANTSVTREVTPGAVTPGMANVHYNGTHGGGCVRLSSPYVPEGMTGVGAYSNPSRGPPINYDPYNGGAYSNPNPSSGPPMNCSPYNGAYSNPSNGPPMNCSPYNGAYSNPSNGPPMNHGSYNGAYYHPSSGPPMNHGSYNGTYYHPSSGPPMNHGSYNGAYYHPSSGPPPMNYGSYNGTYYHPSSGLPMNYGNSALGVPRDGSLPSSVAEPKDNVLPRDGSLPSSVAEPKDNVLPRDGSLPSSVAEPKDNVLPRDGSLPSSNVEPKDNVANKNPISTANIATSFTDIVESLVEPEEVQMFGEVAELDPKENPSMKGFMALPDSTEVGTKAGLLQAINFLHGYDNIEGIPFRETEVSALCDELFSLPDDLAKRHLANITRSELYDLTKEGARLCKNTGYTPHRLLVGLALHIRKMKDATLSVASAALGSKKVVDGNSAMSSKSRTVQSSETTTEPKDDDLTEDNEEISQSFLAQIEDHNNQVDREKYSIHSFTSAIKVIKEYDTSVVSAYGGKTFREEAADTICVNMIRYCMDLETGGNHSNNSLTTKMAKLLGALTLSAPKKEGYKNRRREISEEVLTEYQRKRNSLHSEAKIDKASGRANAFKPFTDKDTLHVLHKSIEHQLETDGTRLLQYKSIDVLCKITVGQVTGRRNFEMYCIAAAETKFEIVDGIGRMTITYCWKKCVGIGKFQQMFVASKKIEQDAICFLLLKFQHMGMIQNAAEVFRGKEVLKPDRSVFESSALLQQKLHNVCKKLKSDHFKALKDGDGEKDPCSVIGQQIIACDNIEDPAYRVPMWCAISTHYNGVSSKRMPQKTFESYISTHICIDKRNPNALHMGYKNSSNHMIGTTCTRKNFRIATDGLIAAGNANFDLARHRNSHMSHTEQVAQRHYEEENVYQTRYPSNMMQSHDQETCDKILKNVQHPPLYTREGFYTEGYEFYKEDFDQTPEEFLDEQSKLKIFTGQYVCPVIGCNHETKYQFKADLMALHIKTSHKGKFYSTFSKCPACHRELATHYLFKEHTSLGGKPSRFCQKAGSNWLVHRHSLGKSNGTARANEKRGWGEASRRMAEAKERVVQNFATFLGKAECMASKSVLNTRPNTNESKSSITNDVEILDDNDMEISTGKESVDSNANILSDDDNPGNVINLNSRPRRPCTIGRKYTMDESTDDSEESGNEDDLDKATDNEMDHEMDKPHHKSEYELRAEQKKKKNEDLLKKLGLWNWSSGQATHSNVVECKRTQSRKYSDDSDYCPEDLDNDLEDDLDDEPDDDLDDKENVQNNNKKRDAKQPPSATKKPKKLKKSPFESVQKYDLEKTNELLNQAREQSSSNEEYHPKILKILAASGIFETIAQSNKAANFFHQLKNGDWKSSLDIAKGIGYSSANANNFKKIYSTFRKDLGLVVKVNGPVRLRLTEKAFIAGGRPAC